MANSQWRKAIGNDYLLDHSPLAIHYWPLECLSQPKTYPVITPLKGSSNETKVFSLFTPSNGGIINGIYLT